MPERLRIEIKGVWMNNKLGRCNICKEYTAINVEVSPGMKIYACQKCLESAKQNFIWICMACGKVYIRPKKVVINRLIDIELKRAYLLCEHMQIIQGIDACVSCDPESILEAMEKCVHGSA
jgi:hypothetical protein